MRKSIVIALTIISGLIIACTDDKTSPQAAGNTHGTTVAREKVIAATDISASADTGPWSDNPESSAGSTRPPQEAVKATEKGQLKNPYDPNDKAIAQLGHDTFIKYGCNGCHGGTGGGGMGPPLTNQKWVYGEEPDTLFRLVAMGSQYLLDNGYSRIANENVVGPMPPQAHVKTEDDLWKIITWIKSMHLPSEEPAQ